MAEEIEEAERIRQSQKKEVQRAQEDYDREVVLADAQILKCQQAYEAAQKALSLYDQYLAEASQPAGSGENNGALPPDGGATGDGLGTDTGNGAEADGGGLGSVPEDIGNSEETEGTGNEGSDSGDEVGSLNEVVSVVTDPEQQYNKQEKRFQLEQDVMIAAQAVEEAVRQKEDRLRDAARAVEDAEAAVETVNSAVSIAALDIEYQKTKLQYLEELLEAGGWVYAEASGYVTDCRLEVGGRTPDDACIIYALDDGERILSAELKEEQEEYVSVGTIFEMKAAMSDGSRGAGTAVVDYLEKGADGVTRARLSFDLEDMSMGQSAELTYKMQTDSFGTCVSGNCIYPEGDNSYYVYIAEEQAGILGTEWKVRKIKVRILEQNDTVAAVQSAEITGDTRIVSGTNKPLQDGDTVRVLQ